MSGGNNVPFDGCTSKNYDYSTFTFEYAAKILAVSKELVRSLMIYLREREFRFQCHRFCKADELLDEAISYNIITAFLRV